jgi:protein phosphatase
VFIGILAIVLVPIAIGAKIALQSIYFVGTNGQGYVTVYQGVPYNLPGGGHLYTTDFVSGVNAQSLNGERRRTLLDHTLRSRNDALSLVRQLELGRLTN